jgi:hypothetical protein
MPDSGDFDLDKTAVLEEAQGILEDCNYDRDKAVERCMKLTPSRKTRERVVLYTGWREILREIGNFDRRHLTEIAAKNEKPDRTSRRWAFEEAAVRKYSFYGNPIMQNTKEELERAIKFRLTTMKSYDADIRAMRTLLTRLVNDTDVVGDKWSVKEVYDILQKRDEEATA